MIRWQVDKERRFPLAARPIPPGSSRSGFPPPWPDRPRTSAAMVASANGVVARAGPGPMTTRCSACWVATTSVRCASPTSDTCVTSGATGRWQSAEMLRSHYCSRRPRSQGTRQLALDQFRHAHGIARATSARLFARRSVRHRDVGLQHTRGRGDHRHHREGSRRPSRVRGAGSGVDLIVDALEDTVSLAPGPCPAFRRGARATWLVKGTDGAGGVARVSSSWTRSSSPKRT